MNEIGNRIKQIRESKNMTIVELANRSGLSDSYLGRLESGQRKDPSLSTLIKVTNALGISIAELIEQNKDCKIELQTIEILDCIVTVDNYTLNNYQKQQLCDFLINI